MNQEQSDISIHQDEKENTEIEVDVIADEIENTDRGNTAADRHTDYRERIKHFILMNDPLARVVFDDDPTLEYMLRILMNKPDLTIVSKTIQADYKNLEGRSVIMDIVAKDSNGIIYNVEIQQKSEGAVPERARYNAGMIDSKELHENEDFTKLPNAFVIFITDRDETDHILSEETIPAVKSGKAGCEKEAEDDPEKPYVHEIVRVDKMTGRIFKDRQTIIYINSRMKADSDLGRLMHDFHCENPDDMYCSEIADRVRRIKESPKEVERMCREMDRIYNDGAKRSQVKVALNMINKEYSANEIVDMTELTLEEVTSLQERKKRKDALAAQV